MTMSATSDHRLLNRVFDASIILKGISGALELIGGVALFFVSADQIRHLLSWVSAHALVVNPHSALAQWIEHLADRMGADATVFAAWYLILHGVIKVVLVWALLREKLWAYPWMLVALGLFIAYQCYELVVHFGWWMFALTIFVVFIVFLTTREWQLHRQRVPTRAASDQ
ncbi:DUF2127 domain-containing protein [Microbacterium shaanxiense]